MRHPIGPIALAVLFTPAGCHRPPPPPFATATLTLTDAARHKDVSVYAAFPTAAGGPWPVIVMSHGNDSAGRSMAGLIDDWAAHGYVCLAPDHDDSVSMRAAALAAGATTLPAAGMIEPMGAGTASVLNRAADVSFVIDQLPTIAAALHVAVDPTRIGVAGHSSGAYTAMLVAGATATMDGVPRSAADPRPRAFILLAPVGAGQGGLTVDSWRQVTRPLMTVTGSLDLVPRPQLPTVEKRDPFARSLPGEKYLAFLAGANHGTFTCDPTDTFYLKQLGGTAEQQAVLFDDVRAVTRAFWDAELKGASTASLRSGDWSRRTAGRVTVEWR